MTMQETVTQPKTYDEAVAYLLDTPRFSSKHTVAETRELLHLLKDPDRGFPIVHVAGTNGKGSVTAYLGSIFEKLGRKTALFTSPHLVDIRERMVCGGREITREEFLDAFTRVWEVCAGEGAKYGPPTFFEYLFLMAMVWFAKCGPDVCVLETGLGGRLDATNAVSRKAAAVITRIGLDHMQYLGETVSEIAGEKAGILMPGVPVFYADDVPEASRVISARARELGCPAFPFAFRSLEGLRFSEKNIDFSLKTRYYGDVCLDAPTPARYQARNIPLAVLCAEEILRQMGESDPEGVPAPEAVRKAFREGVSACRWPARMEELAPELYLDGGHNPDGIAAFLDTVRGDGKAHRSLLFGAVSDKQYEEMLGMLTGSGLFERIFLTPLESGRSVSGEELRRLTGTTPKEGDAPALCLCPDAEEGLSELLKEQRNGSRCYIVGSLYLAGEIRRIIGRPEHDQL